LAEEYDALVVSTGVANGFWRRPTLQSAGEIGADLRGAHERLSVERVMMPWIVRWGMYRGVRENHPLG
jgi:hypothetical protein